MTPAQLKKPSARKSLCIFTNILDVKKKTAIHQAVAAKSKHTEIKAGNTLWEKKTKRNGNWEINDQINKSLYNWIICHPQVLQSPIFNDCLKVKIYGHTRPQMVPKLLLKVSVRDLHNSIVSNPGDGGIKEARYANNNIIISNSTLRSLFPPQQKNVSTIKGHVWLWILYIYQNYTFLITIMEWLVIKKTQRSKPKFSKHKICWKIKLYIWNI